MSELIIPDICAVHWNFLKFKFSVNNNKGAWLRIRSQISCLKLLQCVTKHWKVLWNAGSPFKLPEICTKQGLIRKIEFSNSHIQLGWSNMSSI